jgi:TMEM175 potassium channel family protein
MAEPERSTAPIDLGSGRLEAFSDAVMAVIITLLAFELKPPEAASRAALAAVFPGFAIYVLSFLFIAIYWNNHHHLLRATTVISGGVMWSNMALLLCLSLIPVTAEWIRNAYELSAEVPGRPADIALSVAFFGLVGLASALAYYILVRTIIRANGTDSLVGTSVHADLKGKISLVLYAVGAGLAFWNVWVAYALYAAVAVMWLVPDRRFTREPTGTG